MSAPRLKFVPIVVCLAFGLANCGDDTKSSDSASTATDAGDDGYDRGPDTTAAESTDTTAGVPVSGDLTIQVADNSLGQILVDSAGNTLYVFMSDPAETVTCTGGCASTWPGLLRDGNPILLGEGIDPSLVSTVSGDGGAPQVAINGHPLYTYSGDSAPGDTNGQGVGDVWFVVDANGDAITG